MKNEAKDEKLKKYNDPLVYSSTELFEAIDTIPIPHPYCITPRHIATASDKHSGILDADAIRDAEKTNKAVCDICKHINKKDPSKPILSYDEHGQALLLAVKSDKELKDIPELKDYLLEIKPLLITDNFQGIAFKQIKPAEAEASKGAEK